MMSKTQQIEQLLDSISVRFPDKRMHNLVKMSKSRKKTIMIEYLEGSEEEFHREFECRNIFEVSHWEEKWKKGLYISPL